MISGSGPPDCAELTLAEDLTGKFKIGMSANAAARYANEILTQMRPFDLSQTLQINNRNTSDSVIPYRGHIVIAYVTDVTIQRRVPNN